MLSEEPQTRARSLAFLAGAVCVILISLLGFLQWRQARTEKAVSLAVERSHEREQLVSDYLSLLRDVETGQRGFLVTGSREFLQPFYQAMSHLRKSEAELTRAYAGQPGQARVRELLATGRQRSSHSAETLRLWSAGQESEALTMIKEGTGKRLMDRARVLSDDLVEPEEAYAQRLLIDANGGRQQQQRAIMLTEIAVLLSLLVLVTGLFRTVRGLETSSEQLRDAATRQGAIFENATDAMMMLDANGNIEATNAAAEKLFGRERATMQGRSNLELFDDPPPVEVSQAYLARLASGAAEGENEQDFIGRRGDGSTVEAEVVTTPIRLADGLHFLAIARDATERRQAERMKSEFVATVSHELRTPLTSIGGSLGLLTGGAAGELPPKALRLVEIAHSNTERLIRLINDILDIEKIESGKLRFEMRMVDLCAILDQAVQDNAAFAARHEVKLRFDRCPADWAILADPDRLMQVFTNLLSNAVKFSPQGGEVIVSAGKRGERVTISVSDQGPGIPEEFKARIFGKFAQADSTDSRRKGGTGLGLSIVKELTVRMGGEVSFDSKAGEGTRFHVDFPLVPVAGAPSDLLGRLPEAGLKQILHVDDDPDMLRLVASAFEGLADVHSTPSVQEAHASLQRYRFDAVILDIGMNDGNGLDLIPLVKAASPDAPILLFTARDEQEFPEGRIDAWLTKSKADLVQLVSTAEALMEEKAGTHG